MAKSKVLEAVQMDTKPKPGARVYLHENDMEHHKVKRHEVGKKVRVTGVAHVTSAGESQHEDGEKHQHMELRFKHFNVKPHKEPEGHAGGKYADATKGAKAAMDDALNEPDGDEDDDQ